jgi:hypothetical protein
LVFATAAIDHATIDKNGADAVGRYQQTAQK